MKRLGTTRGFVVITIMLVLVMGYYFYLSNRPVSQPEEAVATEDVLTPAQEALARNLETNYPPTPREVVKYFSQITQCFYDEKTTDDEVVSLGYKIREIYDDELVANQTEENYLSSLKSDVAEYRANKRTISNYAPSSSVDVETFSQDGREWARLYCIYSIKQGELLYNTNMVFVLRKDDAGHYKIYGWKIVEE